MIGQTRWLLGFALGLFLFFLVESASAQVVLHVAPNGDDGNPGTAARPLTTLHAAREMLRRQKPEQGAVVLVHEGDYPLSETFELSEDDSLPRGARLEFRAVGKVRLIGGVEVTGFKPYKGRILRADVAALGLGKIPPPKFSRFSGNVPGFELFFRGERMPLARWPNRISGDKRRGEWAYIPKAPFKTRKWFYYAGDRPARWTHPQEAQVHWFPWYNYMDQFIGIKSIDGEKKIIHLDGNAVYMAQAGRRYYVRNVFEELDAPGEWYFDREKEVLYFWPPKPLDEGKVVVSRLATILRLDGVSNVTVRGFVIECCRGDGVVVSGGRKNTIAGCVVRNVLRDGIVIDGGTNNAAVGNDIYAVGCRGILLAGGDRKTLAPARNRAINNHIHHMSQLLHTYMPGVLVRGCGNLVQHNLIHDGPHMAIGLSGNDHLVEYNEIHHVMLITSHGGAFYCGRDFTARGDVLRYNKFHDIKGYGIDTVDWLRGVLVYSSPVRHLPGAFGVHLDDQMSGFHIYGNVFYRIAHGVIRLGGGRDTVIENNVFVDTGWSVHIDNRGMGWQRRSLQKGTLAKRLNAVAYKSPPWSNRYPELVDIREDRFGEPVDNIVRRNIFVQRTTLYNFMRVPSDRFTCDYNLVWREGEPIVVMARTYRPNRGGEMPFAEWQEMGFDTHSIVADPLFVDAARDDYRLRSESPAFKIGFKPIPLEAIGLYSDELRASPPPPRDTRKMSSEVEIEEYPIPGWQPPSRKNVELAVPPAAAEVRVDGRITQAEWAGAAALPMAITYRGEPVRFKSRAWVTHDGKNLYVAVSNDVHPRRPVSKTTRWGRDDAVEIAIQDVSGGTPGPIFVLRGYPSGKQVSSTEAGAPQNLARKVGAAARFAAKIEGKDRWNAEWRLPLSALGVRLPRPAFALRLRFNVTAYKAATREWVMWRPTFGNSWRVDRTGTLKLVLRGG